MTSERKPIDIKRLEDLYAWAVAWDCSPDRSADMLDLERKNREEFKATVATHVRDALETSRSATTTETGEHDCELPNPVWELGPPPGVAWCRTCGMDYYNRTWLDPLYTVPGGRWLPIHPTKWSHRKYRREIYAMKGSASGRKR